MQKTSETLQKLITLLITWGLLLALFIGYERYFVARQEVFLRNTEFHAVERLARELEAQVQRAQISVASYVQLAAGERNPSPPETLTEFLRMYLANTWSGNHEERIRAKSIETAEHCLVREGVDTVKTDSNGLSLIFSCANRAPKTSTVKTDDTGKLLTLDLAPWIKEALEPLGGDFDDVLIANAEDGESYFQKSSEGPRIANVRSLLVDVVDTKQIDSKPTSTGISTGNATDSASKNVPVGDKHLNRFRDASVSTRTLIGSEEYDLFSVPVEISLSGRDPGNKWRLLVVGLERSERFEARSRAIPYSTMIWVTLFAAAVFALSWPVAKLRYMSNTERFTPKEGWLLVLTIFLASTSVTLMLLNATYNAQSQSQTDVHLKDLAQRIKANFAKEMELAESQMENLHPFECGPKDQDKISDLLGSCQQPVSIYPYFEIAFWVDRDGHQKRKLDIRPAPTPLVYVGNLPFFSKTLPDPTELQGKSGEATSASLGAVESIADHSSHHHYYLDPELSITTAEFAPVLAAANSKDGRGEPAVQAMVVRPISLVDPMLPPGYGFAVIDSACKVLFHSDSFRNTKENFCEESRGTKELTPWLFAGTDSPIDISYAGQPERAFITSMDSADVPVPPMPSFAGGRAYLVVFRSSDYALTMNLAIIVVCAILLSVYLLVLLIVIGIHMSLRGPLKGITAPRKMWPNADNCFKYIQVFVVNCAMLVLYSCLYSRLFEAPLLGLTLLVALLSVLFLFLKLSCHSYVLSRFGMLLLILALIGFLSMLFAHAHSAPPTWSDWWMVGLFLAIAGALAIVLARLDKLIEHLIARTPRWSARIQREVTVKFAGAYSLAVITVITGASAVPSVGCFKFAYDMVNEMALKHDEIAISRSLAARRDRVHRYYLNLIPNPSSPEFSRAERTIWQTAQQRLDNPLDRYDRCGSPPIPPTSCFDYATELPFDADSAPKSSNGLKPQDNSGFNEQLERLIASAVLFFPANKLGAEMSKLGVAATDDAYVRGDYEFEEPSPNRFRLYWQPGSGLPPQFTVESEYDLWPGFKWWGEAFSALLWIVLSLWLTSLVRKIFLTDVPTLLDSEGAGWKNTSEIPGHCLVIGFAESGKSDKLRSIEGILDQDKFDLRVGLRLPLSDVSYPNPSSDNAVVVLDHFEFNLNDREANQIRLNLVEHLLYETKCKILLISTVDPLYYLTEGSPDVLADPSKSELSRILLDRWARVLTNFQKVYLRPTTDENFIAKIRQFQLDHQEQREFAVMVRGECNRTSRLRRIGLSLLVDFDETLPVSKDLVISMVMDKAAEYYRILWSGLSASERLVLYQLALDGWVNPKNTTALHQLESKLLIRRNPMFRIMNMSFRRFVASSEHISEIGQWEREQKQSTWRALRFILIGVFVILGVWVLHAQAALSQEVTGIIGGIATLLTAISTLFFRSGNPSKDK